MRSFPLFGTQFPMDGFLLSHRELRAVLRLARKEIVKLNFGKRDTPLLRLIDRVQDEAKAAARMAGFSPSPVSKTSPEVPIQ